MLKPFLQNQRTIRKIEQNAPQLNTTGQMYSPAHGWCHVRGGLSFTYTHETETAARRDQFLSRHLMPRLYEFSVFEGEGPESSPQP